MTREHRVFAATYDVLGAISERRLIGPWRAELLRDVTGRVLELGAGTGANLAHFPPLDELVLTEPDPAMRRRLVRRADAAGRTARIVDAPAEVLPFEDESFDVVVTTLVMCSVTDPAAAVREIRRVLRSGGRYLFLEHGGAGGRLGRWQCRLDPVWGVFSAGCSLSRDVLRAVEPAGFTEVTSERRMPRGALILNPFTMGAAVA